MRLPPSRQDKGQAGDSLGRSAQGSNGHDQRQPPERSIEEEKGGGVFTYALLMDDDVRAFTPAICP